MTEPLGIDVQAITRRAHELWLKRGCPTGNPELDWLEAERELRAEVGARDARPAVTTTRVPAPSDGTPRVPRPRAPRSIITRAGPASAARLLLALVPEANPDRAMESAARASRQR